MIVCVNVILGNKPQRGCLEIIPVESPEPPLIILWHVDPLLGNDWETNS
jgi:hypothetical protein